MRGTTSPSPDTLVGAVLSPHLPHHHGLPPAELRAQLHLSSIRSLLPGTWSLWQEEWLVERLTRGEKVNKADDDEVRMKVNQNRSTGVIETERQVSHQSHLGGTLTIHSDVLIITCFLLSNLTCRNLAYKTLNPVQ